MVSRVAGRLRLVVDSLKIYVSFAKETYMCGVSCCYYGVALISRLLQKYKSLLQNIVSFIGLFCKRDLSF